MGRVHHGGADHGLCPVGLACHAQSVLVRAGDGVEGRRDDEALARPRRPGVLVRVAKGCGELEALKARTDDVLPDIRIIGVMLQGRQLPVLRELERTARSLERALVDEQARITADVDRRARAGVQRQGDARPIQDAALQIGGLLADGLLGAVLLRAPNVWRTAARLLAHRALLHDPRLEDQVEAHQARVGQSRCDRAT